MGDTSARYGLPLLAAGQAQKEIVHNEALALVDALIQPAVQAIGTLDPPASPAAGQAWVVGAGARGAWSGQDGTLASWTDDGWRFAPLRAGATVWRADQGGYAVLTATGWSGLLPSAGLSVSGVQVVGARGPAVANPSGGSVVDVEVRATVVAILSRLRAHGLIDP